MLAMELVRDRETKSPAPELVGGAIAAAREHGLLLLGAACYGNVIRLLPPLTIADEELDRGWRSSKSRSCEDAAMHALEPLSADEFRQAAAILRRERGVGERWRFASIELKEPEKGATAPRARGDRGVLEPGRRRGLPRRHVAAGDTRRPLGGPARHPAQPDAGRVARVRRGAARTSRR